MSTHDRPTPARVGLYESGRDAGLHLLPVCAVGLLLWLLAAGALWALVQVAARLIGGAA